MHGGQPKRLAEHCFSSMMIPSLSMHSMDGQWACVDTVSLRSDIDGRIGSKCSLQYEAAGPREKQWLFTDLRKIIYRLRAEQSYPVCPCWDNQGSQLSDKEFASIHAPDLRSPVLKTAWDAWIYGVLRGNNTANMTTIPSSPLAAQHNSDVRSGSFAFRQPDTVRLRLFYPHES
ncbi:hypothetical protein TgHK011_003630 [Trichoderma gracile]|nr:hypothetical protein TgHK011_003630 [Trichoderma gracile]